ncbi:MAG: SDR family oxidoreductase [Methylococcales bacterium]
MAKILIVGCGSIGMQLANTLSAKGHQVTGLKRHPPSRVTDDINYFTADITVSDQLNDLPTDFEIVYFIVSPDGRNEESYRTIYETGLDNLISRLSLSGSPARWIFVSSTSVYGQTQGEWVDEKSITDPINRTSQLIRQAEKRLMDLSTYNIVVRFSGIYGPGREYLLRLASQSPVIQQEPPYFTNRIHQQDCVGVLAFLCECHLAGIQLEQCYVASDDDPAPMWEVISWLAAQMDCQPPTIKMTDDKPDMNKRCNNQRLKDLGYTFKYPNYKSGYLELLIDYVQ